METVLVTGANRGIGLELARTFLASDRRVLAACRAPGSAVELASLADDAQLEVLELDVTDPRSVSQLAALLKGRRIDVVINNAGVMAREDPGLEAIDYDGWARTLDVNTLGPLRVALALLDNLRRADRPRVVTLSSQMGALGRPGRGWFAYRSSKAAVNKVMQLLAAELEEEGIVVCPVHPGWVRTDMGGRGADLSVEESATGLVRLVDGLTLEHSGRFWTWKGEEHPW